MKKILFFSILSGALLLFATAQGQYKYIYKPKTAQAVNNNNNRKTFQFRPANKQSNTATPANNNQNSSSNRFQQIEASHPVRAASWANFKNSELYRERQARFANTYQNPSHTYTMDDGSTLTLSFIKNPSFGGMANQVNTQASPGAPIHGGSNSSQSGWNCTTNNITVTAKSTNFDVADYSQQANHIYPGAIYTFTNYTNGSFSSPLGIRNPITIFTDDRNIQGNNSILVNNPDIQSIHNAVSELSQQFPKNYSANGATDFSYYESDNTADMSIKATAGGSGYGFSFKAAFGETNNSHDRYLTIDAKKILFTVSTLPPQNGYYTDASVENTPNLMVIGTVTYGIRILANLTINISSDSMGAALDAAYKGAFSANAGLNFLQQNSSAITNVNAFEIGGPEVGAVQINKNDLINSINSILSGATYQNAQPISYQLYDMAGNVIGSSSATDQFIQQSCSPSPNAFTPILTAATVSINCGGDCKDHDTHYEYDLYNDAGQRVGYFRNNSDNTEWANGSMNQSGDHLTISGSPKLSDFTNGTPTFKMTIYPNGNDDVVMSQITLTLTFTSPNGSSVQNYSCPWAGVTLTKDGPTANLLFNYSTGAGFKPQGQGTSNSN